MVANLHNLKISMTQKEFHDNWTKEHSKAFQGAKEVEVIATLFLHPVKDGTMEIWTDARDSRVRALLFQLQQGELGPLG